MRSSPRGRRPFAALTAVVLAAGLFPAVAASAQEGPFPEELVLVPESDTAVSGTCNEFTARVTGVGDTPGGSPVAGAIVDVVQTLSVPGNEPAETRELAFCNPVNPAGPNATGQGGTSFADVSGNNQAESPGDAGRNTTVRGEVGPTNANGEVTFGITMTPETTAGSVTVTAWVDVDSEGDSLGEGEAWDSSTKTWSAVQPPSVTSVDAAPESASNLNGTQHGVTVTVSADGAPVEGVVPKNIITADASARPPGDVANPAAGASPNFVPGKAKPSVYTCSPSNAHGVSTCTFQDPVATGAGTDTIVFFADLGGEANEPDQNEPQDAVQKTWFLPSDGSTPPPVTREPRNIRLCHGASPDPVCDTSFKDVSSPGEHTLSVLVTDQEGDPLGSVSVEIRELGPATFASNGASTVLVSTGPDGTARMVLETDEWGTSMIVAEIGPPGTAGSTRGPGSSDDECEQPAGAGGSPQAGNCVSASLTVAWSHRDPPPPTLCDDGLDNDGDHLVDLEDPGCVDADDESELPVDVEHVRHDRRINMRFRDWVGPGDEGLVIFGRVRVDDGFRKCTQGQTVLIQRRVDDGWETRKVATTNARGRYAGVVFDRTGPYRAVAPRSEIRAETALHVCRRAQIVKTHHHRR